MKNPRLIFFVPFIVLILFIVLSTSNGSKGLNPSIDLTSRYETGYEETPSCDQSSKSQIGSGTQATFDNSVLLIDRKYQAWFVTYARFRDSTAVMTTGLREWPAGTYSCWPEGILVISDKSKIFVGTDDAFNAVYTWDKTIRINNGVKTLHGESLESGIERVTDRKLSNLIAYWISKMNAGEACFEGDFSVSHAMLCP